MQELHVFAQTPEFWAGMAIGAFLIIGLMALAVLVIYLCAQIAQPEDEPDLGSVMPPEPPRLGPGMERRITDRIRFTPDPLIAARINATLSPRQRHALRGVGEGY